MIFYKLSFNNTLSSVHPTLIFTSTRYSLGMRSEESGSKSSSSPRFTDEKDSIQLTQKRFCSISFEESSSPCSWNDSERRLSAALHMTQLPSGPSTWKSSRIKRFTRVSINDSSASANRSCVSFGNFLSDACKSGSRCGSTLPRCNTSLHSVGSTLSTPGLRMIPYAVMLSPFAVSFTLLCTENPKFSNARKCDFENAVV
jgi:hypothetical protein